MIATYMGLITQIDDHIGRLMAWMEQTGRAKYTLIVFTSDHGDYLGDHWMGEKSFFHEPSVRVPLIVVDPSRAADNTRGTVDHHLVEAIDLAPTIVDFMGGQVQDHILEGASLLPLLHGEAVTWREFAVSEMDYSTSQVRVALGRPVRDCRMTMITDGRWKYVHCSGLPPMLFDLDTDPQEIEDLGQVPGFSAERARLHQALSDWAFAPRNRVTMTDADVLARGNAQRDGILIGFWNEEEVAEAQSAGRDGN
jgi:arylsulfatase A-like enzyme